MSLAWACTAYSNPALSGVSRARFGELLEQLAPCWEAARESALRRRRGGDRRRVAGAGPQQRLVFVDRLLVMLVHLRLGLPHTALAELYGVDRSTVSNAIRVVRPLPAAHGFAVPDRPGIRLCTLECVFAYAAAEGVCLRIDGTEAQVRRPKAGHPGRMHDQTAVRTEGIAEQFRQYSTVKAKVDDGYRGLANEFPGQVEALRRSTRTTRRSATTTPGTSGVAASPPRAFPPPRGAFTITWSTVNRHPAPPASGAG